MSASAAAALLFAVNLLNYVDRQILYALLPLIKAELRPSDAALGALASAFMLVYMCAALPVGYWAERGRRARWLASGVGLWSLSTFLGGLSRSYAQLFAARSAVGVGEATFGTLSPALIGEYAPRERRSRALALFSMAIPVGSGLGYAAGGWLGERLGWRPALMLAGLPGLLLAPALLRLPDARASGAPAEAAPGLSAYLGLFLNRSYVAATLAMTFLSYCLGGLAVWMPSFLQRSWGVGPAKGGLLFGGITVAAGLGGSLLGGQLGDALNARTPKGYFWVSGAGLLAAAPLAWGALRAPSLASCLLLICLAEFFAFLYVGPLNGVIVSVLSPRRRAMAFAANIFVIHALGDAVSPTLIGRCSDLWGLGPALDSSLLFLALGGLACLWGARHFESDRVAVREAPGP